MSDGLAEDDVVRVLQLVAGASGIVDWTVTPSSYPASVPSTEALDEVAAVTKDGRTLRVFVKTVRSLRHWPMIELIPEAIREAAFARFPWRVEADVYASPIIDDLPDGLRAPRVYAIDELGDDRVRIWMEYLPPDSAPWDMTRYASAARRLGQMAGRSLREGLPPGSPQLAPGFRFLFAGRVGVLDLPALRSDDTWRHPLLARCARADPDLRGDLLDLADRAPAIMDALDQLPHALAHGDACPQNLLPDPQHDTGFVAIDWGFAALQPLGYDLGQLLAGRAESGELPVPELPALQSTILAAYLDGLIDQDASPNVEDVEQGFVGGLLLRSAFTALPLDRLRQPPDGDEDALFAHRARYARYLLDLWRAQPAASG